MYSIYDAVRMRELFEDGLSIAVSVPTEDHDSENLA